MIKRISYVSLIGTVLTSMSSFEQVSFGQDFYAGKTIRIVLGFPLAAASTRIRESWRATNPMPVPS